MTEQPLLSIIIPVYNGHKFLRQCIDSVINQTYTNWEILLIDDGSTDDSALICDEYARKHERIMVCHQQNSGQAASRNRGVAMAKGTLVSFVDCDDWLEPDMYTAMAEVMETKQTEVVICGYAEEHAGWQKTVRHVETLQVYEAQDAVKKVLQGRIGSYLWSMLFKRDVIREPMPDLNPYEDHATIFKWLLHAHRVAVLPTAFYHYRQLQSSSLHSYNPKNGNHFFQAIKERYHYIAEGNLLPGWESENRRLYLRGCIKLTKDLARMPNYDAQMREIIEDVRSELRRFLPVGCRELGLKYYLRLRLLLYSTSSYVRLLRMSSIFSLSQRRRQRKLMK